MQIILILNTLSLYIQQNNMQQVIDLVSINLILLQQKLHILF